MSKYTVTFTTGALENDPTTTHGAEGMFVAKSRWMGKSLISSGTRVQFFPHNAAEADADLAKALLQAEGADAIGLGKRAKKKLDLEYARELYIKGLTYRTIFFRDAQHKTREWTDENSSKELSRNIAAALSFADNRLQAEEKAELEEVLVNTFNIDAPRLSPEAP